MKGFILGVFILLTSMAQAQTPKFDRLFESYQNQKGVTTIKIGAAMFKLLNKLKVDDDDLKTIQPLLSQVKSLKMLIVENGEANSAIAKTISATIKGLKYEELMTLNNEGNNISFLVENVSDNTDFLTNLVLSIQSDDGSNIFMVLDGTVPMEAVQKLVNESNKTK